jgi:hypothetical protein
MSRIVETIRKPDDNLNKYNSRNYVLLVLTVVIALAFIIAIVRYVLSGGILPNSHKGLSLIAYPTVEAPSSQTSERRTTSITRQPSFDLGTTEGKVIGPTGLPAIGASIIAEKEGGVITSVVKEGGYTANSFVTVDGTNQIIKNYAIWPSSSSSFDFKYL